MAVRVGVSGEVSAVGRESHGCDGSFVAVDGLGMRQRSGMWEVSPEN